jgi:hypothetical protein
MTNEIVGQVKEVWRYPVEVLSGGCAPSSRRGPN